MAYKVKGSDGIELITDSMRAKGMPEGRVSWAVRPFMSKTAQRDWKTARLQEVFLRILMRSEIS